MLNHVSLRLSVSLVAGIQIVVNCVRGLNHFGEGDEGVDQILSVLVRFYFIDVVVAGREVSVVVAVGFLAQIVLRVTVVSAPAGEGDGVQPWSVNFLCCAGNVGFDVQLNIIFTKAVDEALFEDVRAVQSGLVGCGNIVVDTDWEGNASGGQFLDGL